MVGFISEKVRLDPSNARLRDLLSDAHLTAGEYKAGIQVCEDLLRDESVQADPAFLFRVTRRLADCAHRMGDFETAAHRFRCALSLRPEDADALRSLGFLLLDMSELAPNREQRAERLRDAEGAFSRAISAEEGDVELFYGRALSLMRRGLLQEAVRDLARAESVDGGYAPALHKLGECYQQQGRLQEAVGAYDRFVERHHAYYQLFAAHDEAVVPSAYILADVLLRRARCSIGLGALGAAGVDLQAVLQLEVEPFVALAHHFRGQVAMQEGRLQDCVDENTRALALCGTILPALQDRASAYQQLGNEEKAKEDLQLLKHLKLEIKSE